MNAIANSVKHFRFIEVTSQKNPEELVVASSIPTWEYIRTRESSVCFRQVIRRQRKNRTYNRAREQDFQDESPFMEAKMDEEEKRKQLEREELRQLINEASKIEERLAQEVGGSEYSNKEELERQKAERLRNELAQKAKEQVERRKKAEAMFEYGQRAYGQGVYDKSVEILKSALELIESGSSLGGEIQIWLAMAYDANGQKNDCLELYRQLETFHPIRKIQKQAKNLRYITEAPKLKLTKEEVVSIPIMGYEGTSETWSQMVKRRRPRKIKTEKDYWAEFMETRPKWEKSPFFWVALTVWLTVIALALVYQE